MHIITKACNIVKELTKTLKQMDQLQFTKLDQECYLIFFNGQSFNAWFRFSKASKQFNVDFCDYYFEVKTRTEGKKKIHSLLKENYLWTL